MSVAPLPVSTPPNSARPSERRDPFVREALESFGDRLREAEERPLNVVPPWAWLIVGICGAALLTALGFFSVIDLEMTANAPGVLTAPSEMVVLLAEDERLLIDRSVPVKITIPTLEKYGSGRLMARVERVSERPVTAERARAVTGVEAPYKGGLAEVRLAIEHDGRSARSEQKPWPGLHGTARIVIGRRRLLHSVFPFVAR